VAFCSHRSLRLRGGAAVTEKRWTPTVSQSTQCELGEGPHWDSERGQLLWVDILAGRVLIGAPSGSAIEVIRTLEVGRHIGAVVPWTQGGWLAAATTGFIHIADSGAVTELAQPEAGSRVETRMNDGTCDPQGRFWAGSMAYDETPGAGSLYRVDLDGSVERVLEEVTISNGLGWSPDGTTMYVTDTGPGRIDAYDFDGATGAITNRREFFVGAGGRGAPDGLTVDSDGCIWTAQWRGGAVLRLDPSIIGEVDMPVSQPTSCCFGGPDLATLYITSARVGVEGEDLAGVLMQCTPGARGQPAMPFMGELPRS
jgi:sugar lactone lactonase YvrE